MKNSQSRFQCRHRGCSKTFGRKPEMERHWGKTHDGTFERTRCQQAGCTWSSKRTYELKRHLRWNHSLTSNGPPSTPDSPPAFPSASRRQANTCQEPSHPLSDKLMERRTENGTACSLKITGRISQQDTTPQVDSQIDFKGYCDTSPDPHLPPTGFNNFCPSTSPIFHVPTRHVTPSHLLVGQYHLPPPFIPSCDIPKQSIEFDISTNTTHNEGQHRAYFRRSMSPSPEDILHLKLPGCDIWERRSWC